MGIAVALSADGNTAVLGGPDDNDVVGGAWVFTRSGTTWSQQAKLTGSGEAGQGFFGVSVDVTADGNTVLVGASDDNNSTGAAFTYVRSGPSWSQQGSKITGSGASGQSRQ